MLIEIFKEQNFVRLWTSQVLSQVSLQLINFAIILRIFEATGSSVAVGLVWLFYALPALLLGPFSGTIIDLTSRRKLLVATNFAQAITVLFYLPAEAAIWPIYTVIFVYALLNQIYIPAEAAMLPKIVSAGLLPTANTLFIFTVYASFMLGFALAGPLVALLGANALFVLISILLLFATLAVYKLPMDKRRAVIERPSDFWEKFIQGYEFIRENPRVLFPLLLLVLSGIILPIVAILTPAIAQSILMIPLIETSVRIIVPTGLGAVVGAFLVIKVLKGKMRKKKVIALGTFLASLSFFWMGLVLPSLENRVLLGSILSAVLGIAFAMTVIPVQTMLQEQTPDQLRGRIFGALNFLITTISLLPVLFAATIAEFFGVRSIILAMGAILFAIAVISLNSEQVFKFYHAE